MNIEIINIHPGIVEENIIKEMRRIDEIAKTKKNEELWIFFDELNTSLSFSLLNEIFINRSVNGNKINNNIRLIGAGNPIRKWKKKKFSLTPNDEAERRLVYPVQIFPQSLLNFVINFRFLDDETEKLYIFNIIGKIFTKEEKSLHQITTEIISKCHIYLRASFDPSIVSLKEIARFKKIYEFIIDYFTKKNIYLKRKTNEKNLKLKSILCSILLCYCYRLNDQQKRQNFEIELGILFLKLINNGLIFDKKENILESINNDEFKNEILNTNENLNNFSDLIKNEENFLINQIDIDKGISKIIIKEIVFVLFTSIMTNIPLIIVGKPGTGKNLSIQLLIKSMKGKYSNNKFFRLFPKIVPTYFQGSEFTTYENIEILFEKAKKELEYYKVKNVEIPISLIIFDELDLLDKSKENPLMALYTRLDFSEKEGISFVGTSNFSLNEAKFNRASIFYISDENKLNEIIDISKSIVESISPKLINEKIFQILSSTYYQYKQKLKIMKELTVYKRYMSNYKNKLKSKKINISNSIKKMKFSFIKNTSEFKELFEKDKTININFHGNRDIYNLIRGIAFYLRSSQEYNNEEIIQIINGYIERNFGGINYTFSLSSDLLLNDMNEQIESIKIILSDYKVYQKNKIVKINSAFLFKKIYNLNCPYNNLKLNDSYINDYDPKICICDNIKDIYSRFLLIEVNPSFSNLIYHVIKLLNPLKVIDLYNGSPFIDDKNKEYRFKQINKIQNDVEKNKLIIIENLNQIHPFLYDLYNMNYNINDNRKYARIINNDFNKQITFVNDGFKIILFVDKFFIHKCNLAFLSRFEKINIYFGELLNDKLNTISKKILEEINLKKTILKYEKINYS